MKKLLTLGLTALVAVTLTACSSHDFDEYDELRQDILTQIGQWEHKSVYNELSLPGEAQMPQHMMLEFHENQETGEMYMEIRDLSDGGANIVHYTYVDDNTAYIYENYEDMDPEDFDDPDDYVDEYYDVTEYESIEDNFPRVDQIILDALSGFPDESIVDEEGIEFKEFDVERDNDTFDVVASLNYSTDYQGQAIDEDMTWSLEGEYNEFTVISADPQAGEIRFVRQNFFDTFDGIDKDLFEESDS